MSFLPAVRNAFRVVLFLCFMLLHTLWQLTKWLAKSLFGQWRWHKPHWLTASLEALHNGVKACWAHKRWTAFAIIALAALAYGGERAWTWYKNRPQPVTYTFSLKQPQPATWSDGHWKLDTLVVQFSDSVAPLSLVGKPVKKGIALSPKQEGEWQWTSERELVFTPKQEWPIAREFDVRIDEQGLLAEKVLLKEYQGKFTTAPFSARIDKSEFFQDPSDPQLKKLIASLSFSHPVNTDSLEKHIEIQLAEGLHFLDPALAPFSVIYDKPHLHAYVHSASLAVPREDLRLHLLIKKAVKAQADGDGWPNELSDYVVVPGRGSLRFSGMDMAVVDNERFEPTQVFGFQSTAPVAATAFQGKLKAWVLPELDPDGSRYWSEHKISADVLAKSTKLAMSYVDGEHEFNTSHTLRFTAPVGRYVYVLLEESVQAFGGYESIHPQQHLFQVAPYPSLLKLMSQGALLSLSGERKIAYVARDVEAVRIEYGRLLPNQLHHIIEQLNGSFAKPDLSPGLLDRVIERQSEVQNIPEQQPGKAYVGSIELAKYFQQHDQRHGVFVIKIQKVPRDTDPDDTQFNNDYGYDEGGDGATERRLLLVTDLGLIAKRTSNGGYAVFVMSIATGKPVAGALVELAGRNGQALHKELTGADGKVELANFDQMQREKTPLMLIVSKDEDASFLPLNHYDRALDFSRFDIGGIDNAENPQQLNAHAFTDRGLYRPGETAHLMWIVRRADWLGQLDGLPLEIDVTDPRGLTVLKQRQRLPDAGFDSLDYSAPETATTGQYEMHISVIREREEREQIGSASFTVREFEPDRLKVNTTLSANKVEGWLTPAQVQAKIAVMHLFGNPAAGARVENELTLSGGIKNFPRYADYQFTDPAKPLAEAFTEQLPTATTDEKGEAVVDLRLGRFDKASFKLSLSTRAFEPGSGRSVNSLASVLVSSAPYLIGVKTDGDTHYIHRGASRQIQWLAIDSQLNGVAVNDLQLVRIEHRYVSVLARQEDGSYRYVSRLKEIQRDSEPFKLAKEGGSVAMNTNEPGDFVLAIRNAAGETLGSLPYSIAGAANLSRSLERNAELQLSLSKTEYQPGESIEINIRAPYAGAGLITIERDKVYAHTWFKTDTSSSVQHITLPKDLEGGAYINVQFVRDAASSEVFTSPLSFGVAPFTINRAGRTQLADLQVSPRVKPGEVAVFHVATDTPAQAVVIAVDEGILQVARYKTPDPLSFFLQKRRLQVSTSQILDLILPEFQRLMEAAAPGGDADALLAKNLNPFKKKHQPPVAWFSGIVAVPAGGRDFKYEVPDQFNGRLRVFTVLVTPSRIGVYEKATEVQGDLILTSNVPQAAAPDDEVVVTLGVYNNLKGSAKAKINVHLDTEAGLSVVGSADQALEIAEWQEKVAEFRVKANPHLGAAGLKFTAKLEHASARASDSISIRPALVYQTRVQTGSFDQAQYDRPLSRQMFSELRDVNAAAAASPLAWAQGMSAYLGHYPYSCTEQLTSQMIPALVLHRYPELGKNGLDKNGAAKIIGGGNINDAIIALRSRQNDAGGFGMWAGTPVVDDFITLYVTQVLMDAKAHGMEVPEDMLSHAISYVDHYASKPSTGLAGARQRAYAIYLLARYGRQANSALNSLRSDLDERYQDSWPQDVTAVYLAATYHLMKQEDVAGKLLRKMRWQTDGKWSLDEDNYFYDPLVLDAQQLYLLSNHFSDRLPSLPAKVLENIGATISAQRFHSLSAGSLLLALDSYQQAMGVKAGDITLSEVQGDGQKRSLPRNGALASVALSEKALKLWVSRAGEGRVFYQLTENGFDRKVPDKPISNGLEINREYVDDAGKPVTQVKVGDEFVVQLRVRAVDRDRARQITIVDLLPGGIEPVPVVPVSVTLPNPHACQYQCGDGNTETSATGEESGEAASDDTETADNPVDTTEVSASDYSYQSPLGLKVKGPWYFENSDIRDDRVVIYGDLNGRDMVTLSYRVRATNPGTFQIPPAWVEGMYDRALNARGPRASLTIVKP